LEEDADLWSRVHGNDGRWDLLCALRPHRRLTPAIEILIAGSVNSQRSFPVNLGKKAGNEGSVATIEIKLTPVTACGGNGAPAAAPAPQPNRLYPLTADEIPDDR
jgi:hypothetical protein